MAHGKPCLLRVKCNGSPSDTTVAAHSNSQKPKGWFAQRFIADDKKHRFDCLACGKPMFFPKTKNGKYTHCSDECRESYKKEKMNERARTCKACSSLFYPRPLQIKLGQGIYCSSKCSVIALESGRTKSSWEKAAATNRKLREDGKFKILKGAENPKWKGGKEESLKRRLSSGAAAKTTKKYRKENPHKVKEFTLRRKSKKIGRLPNGTIKKIGDSQKWLCVVCRVNIKIKYHMDHINPLARGGLHEPSNIQLLCPSCNVRKSAKDSISFMQANGYLL
jgi:hypothetical protein